MILVNKNSRGFTIVELLIAMTVFQVALIIATTSYLQLSRYYTKSLNAARLQQVSNNVVDEISRTIQNTGGLVVESGGNNTFGAINVDGGTQNKTATKSVFFASQRTIDSRTFNVVCVDTLRYVYRLNALEPGENAAVNGDHVFMVDTIPTPAACDSAVFPFSSLRILLLKDMSLQQFGVAKNSNDANGTAYNVWLFASFTNNLDPINGDLDLSNMTFDPLTSIPNSNAYIACKGGSGRQFCAVSNINTTVVRRIGL